MVGVVRIWPSLSFPQLAKVPLDLSATEWSYPATTATKSVPVGVSCTAAPSPQVIIVPSALRCRRRHERPLSRILPQLPWDLMCLLNLLRFLPILQLQLHLRLISPRLADAHAAMQRLNPFRITKTILRLSIERSICSSLFPFDKIEGRSLVYVPELFVKRITCMQSIFEMTMENH